MLHTYRLCICLRERLIYFSSESSAFIEILVKTVNFSQNLLILTHRRYKEMNLLFMALLDRLLDDIHEKYACFRL